jgi:AcrR family transcriptional regulator
MADTTPLTAAGQPRWQRRPEARAEEILSAAQQVFGECGFARARLDDVARLAGVSKGTLYLYFDSKESLFRDMLRAKVVAALAEGEELVRTHRGSARDLLVLLVSRMYRCMRDDAMVRLSRVIQAELGSFPELAQFYFEEVILRSRRLIEQVLEQGIASGEFRPGVRGFGARGLAFLVVKTASVQCLFGAMDPESMSEQQALEGMVDLYLHGVLARPGEPS